MLEEARLQTELAGDDGPANEAGSTKSPIAARVLELLRKAPSGLVWLTGIFCDAVFSLSLLASFSVVLANIIGRDLFQVSLVWYSDITGLCIPVAAFIGGARAFGLGRSTAYTGLVDRFTGRIRESLQSFSSAWVFVVSGWLFLISHQVVSASAQDLSPVLQIPGSWAALGLEIGLLVTVIYAMRNLVASGWRAAVGGVAISVVVGGVIYAAEAAVGTGATPGQAISLALGAFVVLYLFGTPIIYVLLTSSLLYAEVAGTPLDVVPSNMLAGVGTSTLVAVPFFILAGVMLGDAGLLRPLASLFEIAVRRVRGGLLHAAVVIMYVFSGVSGSKIADVAAVGTGLRESVAEAGYDREDLATVLQASAVMGEIIPPSIVMIILGSITTISIGQLFLAGLVPAALLGLIIIGTTLVRVPRPPAENSPAAKRPTRRELIVTGARAIPSVVMPAVILLSIYTGIATPTEASAEAVAFGLLWLLFSRYQRRGLSIKLLHNVESLAGFVLTIVASASAFSFTLSVAGLSNMVSSAFSTLGHSSAPVLLFSIILLPIIGMVLEGLPAILILGPLMVPIAENAGINAVQYGILLILAVGLGTFAPPVGVGMFSTCAVMEVSPAKVMRRFIPYGLAILAGLVLIAFVPGIVNLL